LFVCREETEVTQNSSKRSIVNRSRRRFETPDEVLEREEEKRIIHEAINQLPLKYRKVIHLRHFLDEEDNVGGIESERYRRLATATGISEITLRSQMHRAKNLLKKRLHEQGIDH